MPAQQQQNPAAVNAGIRSLILATAVDMLQGVTSQTYTGNGTADVSATQPVITIQPNYVGALKGFFLKVQATVTNGSAIALNLTSFGPANLLSQIQFVDLANVTRILTTGWHVNLINSMKGKKVFGSALVRLTGFDSPINYGSNWQDEIAAPSQIQAGDTGILTMWYWIPITYSDQDLRGLIYLNVVNATARLLFTLNPRPIAAFGADPFNAVYQGQAAGDLSLARVSSITLTLYQNYLDQLPAGQQGVLLPPLDIATNYELKNTVQGSQIVPNQDYPVQYSNFRYFLSTIAVFNNGTAPFYGVGLDVVYWGLQAANLTFQFKVEPALVMLKVREHLGVDTPPGVYYFGSRSKPINTVQYGNMQLVLNASAAAAGANLQMAYEDFAFLNQVSTAGSLPGS